MFTKLSSRSITHGLLGILLGLSLTACTSAKNPKDPLEGYNRFMHGFNRGVDDIILKPVSSVYNAIIPTPVAKSIRNFFSNIGELPIIANDILQLDLENAFSDITRFIINTTVGIVGLFDVAAPIGYEKNESDFGLTMARWGWENSSYFVLPILGSSTLRDTLGVPVDYWFFSLPRHLDEEWRIAYITLDILSKRAHKLETEESTLQLAPDRYIYERDVYLERRELWIQERQAKQSVDAPTKTHDQHPRSDYSY